MNDAPEQEARFGRGATLMREGDQGDFCYLILAGKVEVFRMSGDSKIMLGEIGEDRVVGEMALIDPAPRSASVVAIEPTICRRINAAALESALAASPPLARYLLQTLIRHIRHASGAQSPEAPQGSEAAAVMFQSERTTTRILDRKVFATGDAIFRIGQPAYSAYLVQSGRVDLVREKPDGEVLHLRSVGSGEVFGELALLTGGNRQASAIARETVTCEAIGVTQFATLLNNSPAVVRALMRIYADMVRSSLT